MPVQKSPRILIAMDSFKGSASSIEIGRFVKEGIQNVLPEARVTVLPVADGGEGTVSALVSTLGGKLANAAVKGPRGAVINAQYGLLSNGDAVLEMASASGLTLITEAERDPFRTTSFGTGQLLKAALESNPKSVFIGLGGSATNDGGVGMAQALGFSFLDKYGNEVGPGAVGVEKIHSIRCDQVYRTLKKTEIVALTDVANPLCGKDGAAYIFGPQKGAKPEDLKRLDESLCQLRDLVEKNSSEKFSALPGAGAAGGLGFGLMAFCGARIQPGIETVLNLCRIDTLLEQHDCVITGEGRLDSQSLYGKAPIGIASRAKKHGLPVIAIVGSCELSPSAVSEAGIDLVLDLIKEPASLEQAMRSTARLARQAGENAMRALLLSMRFKE